MHTHACMHTHAWAHARGRPSSRGRRIHSQQHTPGRRWRRYASTMVDHLILFPTSYLLAPASYSLPPTSHLPPTPYHLLPASCLWRLPPTPSLLLPTSYSLPPTPCLLPLAPAKPECIGSRDAHVDIDRAEAHGRAAARWRGVTCLHGLAHLIVTLPLLHPVHQ